MIEYIELPRSVEVIAEMMAIFAKHPQLKGAVKVNFNMLNDPPFNPAEHDPRDNCFTHGFELVLSESKRVLLSWMVANDRLVNKEKGFQLSVATQGADGRYSHLDEAEITHPTVAAAAAIALFDLG